MSFTHIKYSLGLRKKEYLRHFRNFSFLYAGLLALGLSYYYCLPKKLFSDPVSTVMLSEEGKLLGARIARDGQWRFPVQDTVPDVFAKTIIAFEDKRFYAHPGVDPLATLRALWINLNQGEVVSGGSTLSMQVIRLSRKGKDRTLVEKIIEMLLATRLELRYSKEEILALYASHAPFGGNVVGLDAAAWKYYGRVADKLSWAEAATLAVLPNAPSLIHPGKNRDLLRKKRNFLLNKLKENGTLDQLSHELALEEGLPDKPKALPSYAPHLLEDIHQQRLENPQATAATLTSTIKLSWQQRANELARRYYELYRPSGIHNLAILVAEVNSGEVKAYVGNTPGDDPSHNCAVNIVPARRSTGSIMKPFLYASMLTEGELLPDLLVADVPTRFGAYKPDNFNRSFQGAVPASEALIKSLNIPAVRMLSGYGIQRFKDKLNSIGLKSIDRPAQDYGLTLVLGGGESSLWELCGAYAGMARTLNSYIPNQGKYEKNAYRPLTYQKVEVEGSGKNLSQSAPLSAAAIWHSFEAMLELSRPYGESYWENYASSGKIAWKTGTSYGFRDAWAIGCTPNHVVAVWVGNADGEGRPELMGSAVAAPIMFDMFDVVGEGVRWFEPPYDDLREVEVCQQSGHISTELCPETKRIWAPKTETHTSPCPYHRLVFLDKNQDLRVHGRCESPLDMKKKTYFILPPLQERYYKSQNPDYEGLPPYRQDCLASLRENEKARNMEMVYPASPGAKIYIPRELDGRLSETVFEAAHRDEEARLYWHLDGEYIGKTYTYHEMALRPNAGEHELTLVDEYGEYLKIKFEILEKEELENKS